MGGMDDWFLVYLTTLLNYIDYVVSSGRMIVNDVLERKWKEETVACLNILSRDLPGESEENHELHYIWTYVLIESVAY
jgi:hypothetical protein